MENLRHNILLFATTLLCVVATAAAETNPDQPTKSPRPLYQEGLFAELNEGDLEKAIEIYEQVVQESSKIQRLAAQATYQLGICYLKKDNKTKAAEYFQDVVSNYAAQKTIAKKAAEQLKKIKPESKTSVYAQIDSQTIRFISGQFGRCATLAGQQNLTVNSFIYLWIPTGFVIKAE